MVLRRITSSKTVLITILFCIGFTSVMVSCGTLVSFADPLVPWWWGHEEGPHISSHSWLVEQVRTSRRIWLSGTYDSPDSDSDDRTLHVKERMERAHVQSDGSPTDTTTAKNEKAEAKTRTTKKTSRENTYRNSSTATIIGMATGLRFELFRFLHSLRKSGYEGHIILGVNADIRKSFLDYLITLGVTPKLLTTSTCTYESFFQTKQEEKADPGLSICMEPYLDVKGRWAKYPLAADWLRECSTCTGPVMITDVRDVFFQRDPFGPGTPQVVGLQVFEEHPNMTTENWLVDSPVMACKRVHINEPMLCSGTTIGTRDAMMMYLSAMYDEMKRWIVDPKCRFKMEGDDQSIHNWLFYNGSLNNTVAVKHRQGIVHTVGFDGSVIFRDNMDRHMTQDSRIDNDANHPFPGANGRTWISAEFGLTNEDGEFTNMDKTISPVIHQYDRFGPTLRKWLDKSLRDGNKGR